MARGGRKKKKAPRRKASPAERFGRAAQRFFIAVTALGIAVYLLPLSSRMVEENADDTASSAPVAGEIKVQVLNGCGEPDMALQVARYLRTRGCDVVEMGNANHFHYRNTRVVAKSGVPEMARRVRDALGVGELASDPDSTLLLDVTVLIGADCVPFPPLGAEREEDPESDDGDRR
ncbi:MAG: LytR C-terminal domain-containing protein [Candidatus Eisenbacteria bacterium]|nr:LytR C-terminal domain-containing protein [Candidatus Eisenbacteria bacterium]